MELYVLQPGDLASVCLTVANLYKGLGYASPIVSATHRHMNWFDVTVALPNDVTVYVTVLIVNGMIEIQ